MLIMIATFKKFENKYCGCKVMPNVSEQRINEHTQQTPDLLRVMYFINKCIEYVLINSII